MQTWIFPQFKEFGMSIENIKSADKVERKCVYQDDEKVNLYHL